MLVWAPLAAADDNTAQPLHPAWSACINGRHEQSWVAQIGACTEIIASRSVTGADLAAAYNNRSVAHLARGDSTFAILDASAALEHNPALAPAYSNRGAAYLLQHDSERAIADASRAIELDPSSADAYENRSAAWLMQ